MLSLTYFATILKCNDYAMEISINKASTKAIYKYLIKFKYQTAASLRKWENIIQTTSDWYQVLKLPYLLAMETQLQAIQYHIIYRLFPCKKWLCDIS